MQRTLRKGGRRGAGRRIDCNLLMIFDDFDSDSDTDQDHIWELDERISSITSKKKWLFISVKYRRTCKYGHGRQTEMSIEIMNMNISQWCIKKIIKIWKRKKSGRRIALEKRACIMPKYLSRLLVQAFAFHSSPLAVWVYMRSSQSLRIVKQKINEIRFSFILLSVHSVFFCGGDSTNAKQWQFSSTTSLVKRQKIKVNKSFAID